MAPEYSNWRFFKKESPGLAKQVKPMVGKKKLRSLVEGGMGVITNGDEEISEVVRFGELSEDQLIKASKQVSKIHVIKPLRGKPWEGKGRGHKIENNKTGTSRRRGDLNI